MDEPVPGLAVILKSHPTHRKWGGWGQVRRSSSDYIEVQVKKGIKVKWEEVLQMIAVMGIIETMMKRRREEMNKWNE